MPVSKTRTLLKLAHNIRLFLEQRLPNGNQELRKRKRRLLERKHELEVRNQQLERKLTKMHSALQSPLFLRDPTPVFFLVGLEKSGASWLMNILDSHPEILCKGEGGFFGDEWRRENLRERRNPISTSSLYDTLLTSEYLRLWIERSIWTKDDNPDEHLVNLTRLAVNYFLTERLEKTGKKVAGAKMSLLIQELVDEIDLIYPEAKVIHVVRDGRDVAVSVMHHERNNSIDQSGNQVLDPEEMEKHEAYPENSRSVLKGEGGTSTEKSLREIAECWNIRVGRAIEEGPALFGSRYMEVRYEDLLERPHEEVEKLMEFLDADTSEEAIEQAAGLTTSFEKSTKGRYERDQADPASLFREDVAGGWKNYFTERDKEIYKEVAGNLLVKLGYERDNNW